MKDNIQSAKVVIINIVITFVEAFLASWAVSGNKLDKTVVLSAAAAGASAVWNIVLKPLMKTYGVIYKKA